jgi:hypothetical protein
MAKPIELEVNGKRYSVQGEVHLGPFSPRWRGGNADHGRRSGHWKRHLPCHRYKAEKPSHGSERTGAGAELKPAN